MGQVKGKRTHYKQSGERITMRHMRQWRQRWSAAGGDRRPTHFPHTALEWGERERGRKTERGRKKVGYHSGSWLLEIAAPMPLLPLPASLLSVPLHRYI